MTPTRGPECPSTLTLDAYSAGDSQHVAAHTASCPACSAYLTSLQTEGDAFLRQRPPELFLKQVDAFVPEPARRPWWRVALVVSFAAAVALLVAFPRSGPEVSLKGTALRVLRRTPSGEAEPLVTDARVRAGDVVRLTFSAPAAGWLMVAQLDGSETAVTRFVGQVEVGTTTMPDAIELDDVAGPEWFIAVWSPQPLAPEAVLAKLRGQATHARLSLECHDCRLEAVRLEKP
jgi:hypothetical protein